MYPEILCIPHACRIDSLTHPSCRFRKSRRSVSDIVCPLPVIRRLCTKSCDNLPRMTMKKSIIRKKINDPFLRRALRNFASAYPEARERALGGADFEALRERVSETKLRSLDSLPELIKQFTAAAEAAGATVHYCATGDEARRKILEVARSSGGDSGESGNPAISPSEVDGDTEQENTAERRRTLMVKSKSMTSEEIELNPFLEKEGITCVETDLGEWIIQLAGERPSHMVIPAIHKSRDEVAGLFSQELKKDCLPDIPALVRTARETLRPSFLSASIGFSGTNVAIADSGTLCIVTNEGNARLATTLPATHIALVGVEKIVPSLADALDIFSVLPKNAAGQKISSYISFIKGPTGDDRNLHIVLLDNGRLRLAADRQFRESLKCVRCGACANVCPIYEIVGGHVFGHIYVGGIGVVLTAFFHGLEKARNILGLCIGCRKCNEVCAAKIDIEGMILDLREKMAKIPGQKIMMGTVMRNRKLFHGMLRAAYLAQKPFQGKGGRIRHLPGFLGLEADKRSLPPIAEKPFRDLVNEKKKVDSSKDKKEKVLFFSGCLADFVFPGMCADAMESLEKLGYSVSFPQKQLCCGIPARYSGETEVATDLARLNIDALLEEPADFIVTICPTCTVSLRRDFAELLANDPEYHGKAVELGAKVLNYSELAARKLPVIEPREDTAETVTYHDSCHLKRGCGVSSEPRELLERVGLELREMADCDKCCGFGGSYTFKHAEISVEILKNKIDNIVASGAGAVAVDCPGCKMQIEGGLDAEASGVKVEHTATFVNRAVKS